MNRYLKETQVLTYPLSSSSHESEWKRQSKQDEEGNEAQEGQVEKKRVSSTFWYILSAVKKKFISGSSVNMQKGLDL